MGTFNNFGKRLHVSGPREQIPRDALRRATGIHHIKTGSVRSRAGSTQVSATTNNPHSLFRFNDLRFHGGGDLSANLYRSNVSIDSSLDGTHLRFAALPPTAGVQDYLFVAGGGNSIKVDQSGTVTQWGITIPATGSFAAADGGAGNLSGAYIYRVTFRNSTSGSESNDNGTDVTITVTSKKVDLTAIPTSSDSQVNQRRIYRTVGGGSALLLQSTINDNTTTTLTDDTLDADLDSSNALQTDNGPPPDTVEDISNLHEGRGWMTNSATGTRGRIYYTPSGRIEGFSDFLAITNDDDPMQRVIAWDGSMWAFSESSVFQILGTSTPFTWRKVEGAPGVPAAARDTVVPTRIGIIYQSNEGVQLMRGPVSTKQGGGRQFEGQASSLIGFDAIGILFQGEAAEGILAFEGIVATVARGHYYISDTTNTLSFSLIDGTWRNIGVGVSAIYYEEDNDEILAAFNNSVMQLETEGQTTDAGAAFTWEMETPGEVPSLTQTSLGQLIVIDMNPNGQTITPTLVHDDTATAFATFANTGRIRHEIPVNVDGRVFGVRLAATVSQQVEVFSIAITEHVGN